MHFSYSAIAALFAGLLGFIFLCFFLNKQRRKQHRFLIYFLIVLIYLQVYSFLFQSGLMLSSPWLLNTNIPLIFILGPLLFGYTCDLQQRKLDWRNWVYHLIPFIFVTFYSFNFYLQSNGYKFNIIAESIGASVDPQPFIKTFPSDPWDLNGWIVVELQCLHLFAYGTVMFFSLRKSNANSIWLTLLTFTLMAASVILFLSEGGVINGVRFLNNLLPSLSNLVFTVFVLYLLIIYLIVKPSILSRYLPKYQKSSLEKSWRQKKASDLMDILEQDKLFLSPQLSLQEMADTMGIKKHHLSQVINQELGCTFFELINRFRIQEARQVLKENSECKMESLAYELGYRSKSAFFNAFKKETSLTPGQFAQQF